MDRRGLPGVTVAAETRKAALTAARTAIAPVLEVDPESFDLASFSRPTLSVLQSSLDAMAHPEANF
jgi:hypothetical protein